MQPSQENSLAAPKQVEVGGGVQAKLLRDKLLELEREIERFRAENAALEKLRKEREQVRAVWHIYNEYISTPDRWIPRL